MQIMLVHQCIFVLRDAQGCARGTWQSDERYVLLGAGAAHFLRPDGGLYLADVGLVKIEHAEARLADAATDAQGQRAFCEAAVKVELETGFLVHHGQLPQQGFAVYADAHGG